MSFSIAIIGRPNVGKSTLFNRLVGRRVALVDDQPGVTRDRREGEGRLGDLEFKIVDTAGLEEAAADTLSGRMRAQTEAAIASADVLLYVFDARLGITAADKTFAAAARRSGKPVIVVANKCEGKAGDVGRADAYSLGLGDPIPLSAEHGEGMGDLYDALRDAMPEQPPEDEDRDEDAPDDFSDNDKRPIRVAIVGRPNAGKSTLINRLLGEDRLLTAPDAGTTRDSIAVDVTWGNRQYQIYDTAGMRRRSRIDEKLEKLAVADALNAIRFAEVVVVLIDGAHPFEEQDQRIADLVEQEGRALVLAIGKWDLNENKAGAISRLRDLAAQKLTQLKGVPLVAVSGYTGEGIDRLMQAIVGAYGIWNKRVPTSALNRWFEKATSANPPPAVSGRTLRLNYITQVKTRPPSFVVFCTRADAVPDSYKRYLVNDLRQTFDLPGTPIRMTLRAKANPYAGRKK